MGRVWTPQEYQLLGIFFFFLYSNPGLALLISKQRKILALYPNAEYK